MSYYRDAEWWEPVWGMFYWGLYQRVSEDLVLDGTLTDTVELDYGLSRIADLGGDVITMELGGEWVDGWIDWLHDQKEFEYVEER